MTRTVAPLIGVVALLGIVGWWRPWLQRRRYGSSGVLFLRSGDWRQRARDALGVVLVACLTVQAIAALAWPDALSPVAALAHLDTTLWRLTATLVLVGGLILLVVAQLDLGASWRIGIEPGTRPGLVTNGLYQFCRNPIFLAILVTLAGYTMLVPTRLSILLLVGAFIGIRQQVLTEERYLLATYGDGYRDYARCVGRFLPGIGRLRA
jgi:protein-S-isoprenylcysteine O-methyltransferase Ste14